MRIPKIHVLDDVITLAMMTSQLSQGVTPLTPEVILASMKVSNQSHAPLCDITELLLLRTLILSLEFVIGRNDRGYMVEKK